MQQGWFGGRVVKWLCACVYKREGVGGGLCHLPLPLPPLLRRRRKQRAASKRHHQGGCVCIHMLRWVRVRRGERAMPLGVVCPAALLALSFQRGFWERGRKRCCCCCVVCVLLLLAAVLPSDAAAGG